MVPLVLVEGLPGCGKSTTAQFLARQLRRAGYRARWHYEEETPHPVFRRPAEPTTWDGYFPVSEWRWRVTAKPLVLEFGMGVDVHGLNPTRAACRAVSDAIRHSSLPLLQDIRVHGGKMLVDVTVGVPEPASVDIEVVRRELPHGEVTVRAVAGGLRVPGADTLIACVGITVSAEYPESSPDKEKP